MWPDARCRSTGHRLHENSDAPVFHGLDPRGVLNVASIAVAPLPTVLVGRGPHDHERIDMLARVFRSNS
jgi:hypothetical protein